tara:strand:+ start:6782 stop:7879 length:1098 start_codon:yes stop_codon:yes gene_type:complete
MDPVAFWPDHEKKLREQIATLDGHRSQSLASVYSALWLQHLSVTASRKEFIENMDSTTKPFLGIKEVVEAAFDKMFDQKAVSIKDIRVSLFPISDFVSTYPGDEAIEGAEYLFAPHPEEAGLWGINPRGLDALNDLVRSFIIRSYEVDSFRWKATESEPPFSSVPTDSFVPRFLDFAKDNASCASTDEFLASMRSRFIGRSMNKRGLYAWKNKSFVKTKDFYLCMREIEPDRINKVHHIGSTPILVALEDPKENKTLKQIVAISIIASFLDTSFWDDTFGDSPPARSQLRKHASGEAIGFFCGRYALISGGGSLTDMGKDWDGIKSCILLYTSRHAPSLFEYLRGHRESYRTTTIEDEHAASTCF